MSSRRAAEAKRWIAFSFLAIEPLTTMAIYDDKWFEIWYSDGVDVTPSHFLIVTPNPNSASQILIIDPFEKGKIIFEAKDYETATDWASSTINAPLSC